MLSESDASLIEDERQIESRHIRVPYLSQNFWPGVKAPVYWAGLDLQRFFPSTPTRLIEGSLLRGLRSADVAYQGELDGLIRSMLIFPLELEGWSDSELSEDLKIAEHEREVYAHLPTGLRGVARRSTGFQPPSG